MRTVQESRCASEVVADLVSAEELDAEQGEAVLAALDAAGIGTSAQAVPGGRVGLASGVRSHAAEVAGYLGAVFVGLSAVTFLAQSWDEVSPGTRALLLAGIAVLCAVVAVVVSRGGARPADPVRLRVASTLMSVAALTTGLAVGSALEQSSDGGPWLLTLAPAAALVVAVLGYSLAPTALGHLAMAAAAVATVQFAAAAIAADNPVPAGVGLLVLGLLWLLLVRWGLLREQTLGLVVAGLLCLAGPQLVLAAVVVPAATRVAAYVLTAAVGLACLAGYSVLQRWPLLVLGVGAMALLVPEVLGYWLGESIGVPGLLLASGVTLLVASLLGLRLRRRSPDQELP
jgi:hypothetical protein